MAIGHGKVSISSRQKCCKTHLGHWFGPNTKNFILFFESVQQLGINFHLVACKAIGNSHIDQIIGEGSIPCPWFACKFLGLKVCDTLGTFPPHCKGHIEVQRKDVLDKSDARVNGEYVPWSSEAFIAPYQVLYRNAL